MLHNSSKSFPATINGTVENISRKGDFLHVSFGHAVCAYAGCDEKQRYVSFAGRTLLVPAFAVSVHGLKSHDRVKVDMQWLSGTHSLTRDFDVLAAIEGREPLHTNTEHYFISEVSVVEPGPSAALAA